MECKKCGSNIYVKAGFIKGEQRYLCKICDCKFVPTRQKGKDEKTKMTAIWLYCHGLSFRTIAKFFKVNVRSVFNWVKTFALKNYVKPEPTSDITEIVLELDEMWHYINSKKNKCWIWKAYCRNTNQLIDWECGRRDTDTFAKLLDRIVGWNAEFYFADGWSSYAELIPPEFLVQSKSQTHLIESNNMPQRHWFARFRRKTCVVSRSVQMVDLTTMLYAAYHVNKMIDIAI
jgi:IS1 family transposase/transposase-like protein